MESLELASTIVTYLSLFLFDFAFPVLYFTIFELLELVGTHTKAQPVSVTTVVPVGRVIHHWRLKLTVIIFGGTGFVLLAVAVVSESLCVASLKR